jgi:Fe-S-cluster containining protein
VRLSQIARYGALLADRSTKTAVYLSARAGVPLSCGNGCGSCCRHVVPLSIPEALLLSKLIDALPDEGRAHVQGRFAAAQKTVREGGLAGVPLLSNAMAYFYLRIPCPFLENESCGIYESRPAACREYLVTSPPKSCAEPSISSIEFVPLPVTISECLSMLAGELLDTGPMMIPHISAPDWTGQHPEEGARRWEKGAVFARFESIVKRRCA